MLGFLVTFVAANTGCHDDATEPAAPAVLEAPKDAITRTTENGPVKATVKVWPAKPQLDDPIYAQLEITAPAGIAIDAAFQETGSELGRFKVEQFDRDNERTPDGGQRWRHTYTLRAQLSGKHRVPPLRFEMTDTRKGSASDAGKPQEVLTEEVPLDIAPVSTEAASAKLNPALGDLDPDVGGIGVVAVLALAFGVMIAGAGGVLAYRAMRARRRIQNQRSAYDQAVADLIGLETQGPPDETRVDRWFVALSAIVRRYLEMRYEIRAPELTTEEFLNVAARAAELTTEHRVLLTSFLERCDRVKFAGYRPDTDESLASLKAARGFVEDTRLREPIATAVARKAA